MATRAYVGAAKTSAMLAVAWRQPPLLSRAAFSRGFAAARLVLNHSTHVETLIPSLKRVAETQHAVIDTIVPGRLATTKGRPNGDGLLLRVTVPASAASGASWKVIARRGSQVQEVFFSCKAGTTAAALQAALDAVVPPPAPPKGA